MEYNFISEFPHIIKSSWFVLIKSQEIYAKPYFLLLLTNSPIFFLLKKYLFQDFL